MTEHIVDWGNGIAEAHLFAKDLADSVDLQKIIQSTFGRWLEDRGLSLDFWSGELRDKSSIVEKSGVDKFSGVDYVSYSLEQKVTLFDVVISQSRYDQVVLPDVSLPEIIHRSVEGATVTGHPTGPQYPDGKFLPKPRALEDLRAKAVSEDGDVLDEEHIDLVLKLRVLQPDAFGAALRVADSLTNAEWDNLRQHFKEEGE